MQKKGGGGRRYKIVNEYMSDYAKEIEDNIIKWVNKTQKETGEIVSRDEHEKRTIINDSIGYNKCEAIQHKLFNEESSSQGPGIIEQVINSILWLDTRKKLTKYDKLMMDNKS